MAHLHGVTDTDVRFEIDPYTRKLKDNTPTKKTIVQYDHNSERYTFSLPRYIEGHDMTLCNVVEVSFTNIEKTTGSQNDGYDVITDLHIDPEDEETVLCSWTIPNRSTQYIGPLEFSLRFACKEDDVVTYEWNTIWFTRIQVKSGGNNRKAIDFLKEQIQAVIEAKHLEVPVQAYILVDEDGNEIGSAVLVDEEVTLDATSNDIRLNKTAVTDNGVTVGEKVIPAYHTYEGFRVIPAGSTVTIPNMDSIIDNYDYTKLQVIICSFNTNVDDSVAAEKISIDSNVYNVQSVEPISTVTKNHESKVIELGITNNSDTPWIARFFTYKEV